MKNKKLYAILTLVAFMITLMPVMAFAAPNSTLVSGASVGYTAAGKAVITDATQTSANVLMLKSDGSAFEDASSAFVKAVVDSKNVWTSNVVVAADAKYALATGTGTLTYEAADAANVVSVTKAAAEVEIAADAAKGSISYTASTIGTATSNVSLEAYNNPLSQTLADHQTTMAITMKNASNSRVPAFGTANNPANLPVYVWAESKNAIGEPTDAFALTKTGDGYEVETATLDQGVYELTFDGTEVVGEFEVHFVRGGNYVVKASFTKPNATNSSTSYANIAKLTSEAAYNEIAVSTQSADTSYWKTDVYADMDKNNSFNDVGETIVTGLIDGATAPTAIANVEANTVAVTPVKVVLNNALNNPVANYPVTLETSSANLELSKYKGTTNYNGALEFDIAGLREGEYRIFIQAGDYEGTVKVQIGSTSASNIEVIKAPKAPIATDTENTDMKDFFRFSITDINGNLVTTTKGVTHASNTSSDTKKSKYVTLTSAPTGNRVDDKDLYIENVGDYWTLDIVSGEKFAVEGNYTVKVVLDNGKSANVSFEVKKFGTATNLAIEYPVASVELNGLSGTPDVFFTDANGVIKNAKASRVTLAANGFAVSNLYKGGEVIVEADSDKGITEVRAEMGQVRVKNDEKYLGATITVTAVAERENLVASTTLTVAEEATGIIFDATKNLLVNDYNKLDFKLADPKGNIVALGENTVIDSINVLVVGNTNKDAKVSANVVSTSNGDLLTKGVGVLALTSNAPTTANVQIVVKATTRSGGGSTGLDTKYFTGTQEFTFGDAKDQVLVDKKVTMVTGQTAFTVNGELKVAPVAPFVQDNRTFLPMRALAEAIGAEIAWDQATQTVTLTADKVVTTFVLGSSAITVNGEASAMDVKVFAVDNYTVLPIRFAAEAVGYDVDYTTDAAGVTTVELTKVTK